MFNLTPNISNVKSISSVTLKGSSEPLGNKRKITSHFQPQISLTEKITINDQRKSCKHDGPGSYSLDYITNKRNKRDKYKLQRIAKTLICRDKTDTHGYEFNNFWKCGITPVSDITGIVRSPENKTAYYNNIASCNSVWQCPVCSSKIAVVRYQELDHCMNKHLHGCKQIRGVYMLVLTVSHKKNDKLKELESNLSEAKKIFWRNGSIRRLLNKINTIGRVTSHEVTYSSANGFHPHDHVLLFTDTISYSDQKKYEKRFTELWINSLNKVGLKGNEYSVRFQGGELTSKYVAKLGLEMTLGHIKKGNVFKGVEHFSPFQLLNYISENNSKEEKTKEYIRAFQEYTKAIKGKTQMMYSRGLKDHFGVNEITDQEACELTPEDKVPVLNFVSKDFKKLLLDDLRLDVMDYIGIEDYSRAIYILIKLGVRITEINKNILNILEKQGFNTKNLGG